MIDDMRRLDLSIKIKEDIDAMKEALFARGADDQRCICSLTAWLVSLGCVPELRGAVLHSVNGALNLIKNDGRPTP